MSLLARARHQLLRRRMAGPRLLRRFAAAHPDAVFVEIGANDGEQHDHLRPLILERGWRGLMVEPVPYVFERLARNYAGVAGVTCVNAAVAERDGELPFFHLRQADRDREGLPQWYDGIGSFSRAAVLSHARDIPDVAARLVETSVPALAFDTLLARHGIERVDLVVVDTEGYDWEVVRSIDLDAHRPRLLVYEHYHFGEDVRGRALAHLRSHGYEALEEGFDTFCLDPRPDALTRAFRRLRPAVAPVFAHQEER